VEKPMANSEAECLEMIAAAEKADRVLMVAYVMRYHPLFVKLKELLDEKTYGDLFQLSIWTEQLTRYSEASWVARAETLGGGQLFSHGCHYIDLLLWYLGEPVEGTHLGTNFGTPWMEMEGTSNVSIKFANGALGYHMGTWGARGSRLGYSFHAHCTEAMIEVDFRKSVIILHCPDAKSKTEYDQGDNGAAFPANQALIFEAPKGKNVQFEFGHFIDCIEKGTTPNTNGRDSLQGLRVIWRLYEAEERGVVADLRGLGLGQSG